MCNISNQLKTAQKQLQKYFNYPDFRPQQLPPLKAILEQHKNILALLPTGGGKSMLFTIPALVYPGITIVVSPLVALMENQVIALKSRGIDAEYISSDHNIFPEIQSKQINPKILFLSPERFIMPPFYNWLKTVECNLIALDEAHTYTQFGLSFRFSFRDFFTVLKQFNTQFLAVTATASPTIFEDLTKSYPFDEIFKVPVSRQNISLNINYFKTNIERDEAFLGQFQDQGHQIIYCNSRRRTEWLYYKKYQEIPSLKAYHAGISPELKKETLIGFLDDRYKHIAATTAFGMGIDKGDIDTVHHIDLPLSIEDYTQQVGRGGRNGDPARGITWISIQELIEHHNRLLFPNLVKNIEKLVPEILKNPELLHRSETGKLIRDQLILMKKCIPLNPPECSITVLTRETPYPYLSKRLPALQNGEQNIKTLCKLLDLTEPKLEQMLSYLQSLHILDYTLSHYKLTTFDTNQLIKNIQTSIDAKRQNFTDLIDFIFTSECRHQWLERFYGDETQKVAPNKAINPKTLKKKYSLIKLLKKGKRDLITTLLKHNYHCHFNQNGGFLELS